MTTPSSFRGYETFEHTADIGIRAWGREFAEVFEESGKALFSVMCELDTVAPNQSCAMELTADSGEELFLKWLKELLFLFDTRRLIFSEFHVKKLTPTSLRAEIKGEVLNNRKHRLGREVKAITRHQFNMVKDQARYVAEVILDI